METYKSGKIYLIFDEDHPEQFYIGSTYYDDIKERLAVHRSTSKNPVWKGMLLYKYVNQIGSWDRMKIVLIKDIQREITIQELRTYEGSYIKLLTPPLNKNIAGRSHKQYLNDNKDIIKEQVKKYQIEHKDIIKEQHKKYQIQYVIDHIEKIKERQNKKFDCVVCNGSFTYSHKLKHLKSLKHINAMKQIEQKE